MNKLMTALCTLLCLALITAAMPAQADSLSDAADLIGAYANLLGALDLDEDEPDVPDETSKSFTGPEVTVKVGKKKVKVHKTFKQAMDEYEAFFDRYIEFMKDPDLLRYAEFMAEYAETLEGLEDLSDYDLTSAELAYYLEVYARIMDRLSEV